jgi:predicted anti-sigma-YlaC factor YlaD
MSAAEDMACRELVELITAYLEGAMAAAERVRLEAHLAGCEGCSSYVEQMRRTIELTGMLTEDRVPPEGRDALLGVFREWRSTS